MVAVKFKKPEVGQLVFVRDAGNRLSSSRNYDTPYPVAVKKVGRKYFTLEHPYNHPLDGDRFYLDTWEHENGGCSADSICYPTIEDHLYELEHRKLSHFVSASFQYASVNNYTLDQLRRIEKIIMEGADDMVRQIEESDD